MTADCLAKMSSADTGPKIHWTITFTVFHPVSYIFSYSAYSSCIQISDNYVYFYAAKRAFLVA